MLDQKNSRKQGSVGIGAAIAYFTSLGHSVAIPLTDAQRYDLIVDDGARLFRVEVKTTRSKTSNGYRVHLRTNGGNQTRSTSTQFSDSDADLLFILTDSGERYCIPTSEVRVGAYLQLNDDRDRFRV